MLKEKPKFSKVKMRIQKTEDSLLSQTNFYDRPEDITEIGRFPYQQSHEENIQGDISNEKKNKNLQKDKTKNQETTEAIILHEKQVIDQEYIGMRQFKTKPRRTIGGGKQNNYINQSTNNFETLSIKKIKHANSGHNCSQFLLCGQIPMRGVVKTKSISIDELDRIADNLDILLFKNRTAFSKMQRFFTKSTYDHVAMVIKIQGNRYILQSSGNHGVSLSYFNKFVTNFKSRANPQAGYQLGYRKFLDAKINENDKAKIFAKVQEFVRKSLGKKYKFSPIYLVSRQYKKKQETYFCSQLLAELLNDCGLINLKKPTYTILPRNFINSSQQNEDAEMQIVADFESDDIVNSIYENIKCIKAREDRKNA